MARVLSAARVKAAIEKRNTTFRGKTKAEKRVLIAKDVITQVKSNRFTPAKGDWLSFTKYIDNFNPWDYADAIQDSIQKRYLDKTVVSCKGCALGGLMLACTLYNNKMKFCDNLVYDDIGSALEYGEKIPNGLNTIFSVDQLKLIETAFEKGTGYFAREFTTFEEDDYGNAVGVRRPNEEQQRAIVFGKVYSSASNRLVAIMQNVVKNKGTFIP